jgi:hypothetical protein
MKEITLFRDILKLRFEQEEAFLALKTDNSIPIRERKSQATVIQSQLETSKHALYKAKVKLDKAIGWAEITPKVRGRNGQ